MKPALLHSPHLEVTGEQEERFSPQTCTQAVQTDPAAAVNVFSCPPASFYSHVQCEHHLPAQHL